VSSGVVEVRCGRGIAAATDRSPLQNLRTQKLQNFKTQELKNRATHQALLATLLRTIVTKRNDPLAAVEAELSEATSRAWTLVRSTDPRLFTVRPHPASWSAAECIGHLTISSQIFLEPLQKAIDEARAKGGASEKRPSMDVVGRVLRWFLEPPIRSRVKTGVPFVPRAIRAKGEAFAEFAALQEKLVEMVRAARGVDLSRSKLLSPFDNRVRYNAYSAFRIIAAHQRRHLWQAEKAIAELRARMAAA
jgi:hypothetical protein